MSEELAANTFTGTIMYMSPERLNGEAYSYSSDIWSLGLCLITLATGTFPMKLNGGFWGIFQAVKDENLPMLPPDQFSPELCQFVNSCVQQKPSRRSTAEALLQHAFLKKAQGPPSDLEDYLPDRPKDLESIVGGEKKLVKGMIERAVKYRLARNFDIGTDEGILTSGPPPRVPLFKDR